MDVVSKLPKLEPKVLETFLKTHNTARQQTRSTRSALQPKDDNIEVLDVQLKNDTRSVRKVEDQTFTAKVKETLKPAKRNAPQEKHHIIVVRFLVVRPKIASAVCVACGDKCGVIPSLLYWLQQRQQESVANSQENEGKPEKDENPPKKRKLVRECRVVLAPLDISKLTISSTPGREEKPKLEKIVKEPVHITPAQLERAEKLSMISLMEQFDGDDADEFLQFCTERMPRDVCESVAELTIEQADTDLWHSLRKGRITASRIREASRCTMISGSLTNKIMGVTSGFSFAMKRGTDLEGHVFATLAREYPGLRNVGLVLDPHFPWMGASPDGICDEFVLEIKCPYTEKTHECYVDVTKLSPKYFAQIQLQMHMTHRTKALLAVAALDFETTRNVTKVWIDYQKQYVDELMEPSLEFWRQAIFKLLLRRRNRKK